MGLTPEALRPLSGGGGAGGACVRSGGSMRLEPDQFPSCVCSGVAAVLGCLQSDVGAKAAVLED